MIAAELIAVLEEMDEDADVRLAMQPGQPMQYLIGDVIEVEALDEEGKPTGEIFVYIAEETLVYDSPRLPENAKDCLGWTR